MTEFTKEMIRSLIQLSKIDCTDEEQEALAKDLKNILSYVESLQEVDTENVNPCNHVLEGMVNVTREDVVGKQMPREVFLSNAPSQIGGMIRVPPVIKQGN